MGGLFKFIAPLIGLVVLFLEIGTQQNLISSALNDIHTYFSSTFISTITPFFAFIMIAFGFTLNWSVTSYITDQISFRLQK